MSFKIINPGFGKLFYDYQYHPAYERTGSLYNPKFGVAVYSNDCRIFLGTTAFSDLYLKFDVFLPDSSNNFLNVGGNGVFLQITQSGTSTQITSLRSEELTVTGAQTNLNLNAVNTVWLHLSTGNSYQTTVMVNGATVLDGENAEMHGTFNANSQLVFSIPYEMPLSNLIISDSEILPNEIIALVDASAVDTTMAVREDGSFSGVEVGDYVLQVLNPASLYGIFGAGGKVTGMAAIAAPAFNTGEDSLFLQCRKVNGETVTNYPMDGGDDDVYGAELYYAHELENTASANENDYTPAIGEQIPVASDTTFADLSGLKLGWVIVGS